MATAVTAIIMRARREIASHFMSQNAVSPQDAIPFDPERGIKRRQFERMRDAGVVEHTDDGRYWMNLPAYDQWQQDRRTRAKIVIGAGIAAAALVALFAG